MKIEVQQERRGLTPRYIRVGVHVYQRLNPQHQGTITRADTNGFVVTYDKLTTRTPTVRHWYPISRAWDFIPGTPPIVHIEVPPSDEP